METFLGADVFYELPPTLVDQRTQEDILFIIEQQFERMTGQILFDFDFIERYISKIMKTKFFQLKENLHWIYH